MGSYSIGEAINHLFEKSGWAPKAHEIRLRAEWEQAVGKTIAKYTSNLYLRNHILTIYTNVPALKQELTLGKAQLITRINDYLGEQVIQEIIVK